MIHFGLITGLGQALADLFGDHYRPVLPAGAAKRYGQIAFPFANVMRQQIDQQAADPLHEFHSLRKRPDVPGHSRVFTGQILETRYVIWIRQKTHIENQVAVRRNSVSKAETGDVDHDRRLVAPAAESFADQFAAVRAP